MAIGDRHRSHHLMLFTRQRRQHLRRVRLVLRFFQHPAIEHHYGIGTQHRPRLRCQRHAGFGLILRQTAHIGFRGFPFLPLLFGIRQDNFKGDAQQGQ
ncbi:hypothetical protein D3C80_1621580 [compost metagenome]